MSMIWVPLITRGLVLVSPLLIIHTAPSSQSPVCKGHRNVRGKDGDHVVGRTRPP